MMPNPWDVGRRELSLRWVQGTYNTPFTAVDEAAALGVRRISLGGTLAKTAWRGFLDAAREIAELATFTQFVDLPNLNALLDPG